jgi:hypothetical protein
LKNLNGFNDVSTANVPQYGIPGEQKNAESPGAGKEVNSKVCNDP